MSQLKLVIIYVLALTVYIPLQYTDSYAATGTLDKAKQTAYWRLIGKHKSSAKIENYHDKQINASAIRFTGVATLTGTGGLKGKLSGKNLQRAVTPGLASWYMNMENDFQINFSVDTNLGKRQLSYTSTKRQLPRDNQRIFNLTLEPVPGRWSKVTRNLQLDLQQAEPGNSIRAINFMLIKGSGAISGFSLRTLPVSNRLTHHHSQQTGNHGNNRPATSQTAVLAGREPEIAAALPGGNRRSIRLNTPPGQEFEMSIDGHLTELAWHSAPVANDFRINEDRVRTSNATEVRVLADKNNLYFGFRMFDSRPELIKAIKTLRDGGLGTDDAISVIIDTYRDHNTAATYSINAIGTQNDQLSGGSADKIQWKGDWKGFARKTKYGWSAEMAIPFDNLKFNNDSDTFGLNFTRYQHRTAQSSHWVKPSTDKNRDPLGLISGLSLPQSKNQRNWTLMPYVVAAKNTADRDGELQNQSFYGGLTARYQPTSNLTGLIEVLPDFSQIESQISDIDFSYNEKEITDNRTFFQDGAAYFKSNSEYFYSPRIPDFNGGVKTYMNDGNNAVGALLVNSPDGRSDMAARYRRQFSANSGITLTTSANRSEGELGYLIAGGFDKRFRSGFIVDINTATSKDNSTKQSGGTTNLLLGFGRDQWEAGVKLDHYDVSFAPRNGLVKSDLPGTQATEFYASYYQEQHGLLKQVNTDISLTHRRSLDGQDQNKGLYLASGFDLFEKTRLQLAYNSYQYRPVADTPGTFSTVVNDDSYWSVNLDFNIYSDRVGYGAFLADGILGGGDYNYRSGYIWFNPSHNTNLKISVEDLESFGQFRQATVSAGWDISTTDGIVARYNAGEGYHQSRLAYRRKVSSGMDIFVSGLKDSGNDAEITGKFVWTF